MDLKHLVKVSSPMAAAAALSRTLRLVHLALAARGRPHCTHVSQAHLQVGRLLLRLGGHDARQEARSDRPRALFAAYAPARKPLRQPGAKLQGAQRVVPGKEQHAQRGEGVTVASAMRGCGARLTL